jgi:hypothetical protein
MQMGFLGASMKFSMLHDGQPGNTGEGIEDQLPELKAEAVCAFCRSNQFDRYQSHPPHCKNRPMTVNSQKW